MGKGDVKYEQFNQYGHPLESELPHEIQPVEAWTEHYYFWFYDPKIELGMYFHISRTLADRNMWRPVFVVFMPDQQFLCTTLHGNNGDRLGPGAGGLKVNCIEPHRSWSIHFDGVGARGSRAELMNGLLGARPAEPIRFSLFFDGAAPNFGKHVWGKSNVFSFHTEQIANVRGHICHDGKIIHVDGVGVRDHSSGPRHVAAIIGYIWFQCLFEDGDAIMVTVAHFEKQEVKSAYYYQSGADRNEELRIVEHPPVVGADSGKGTLNRDPLADEGREFVFRLARANGEEITLEGTMITSPAVTLTSPMNEYPGTGEGEGVQIAAGVAQVRWNKKIGYANRERASKLGFLTTPSAKSERLEITHETPAVVNEGRAKPYVADPP
jgi:hypothetical protein